MSEPEPPNVPPGASGSGASEKSSAPAGGTPDLASRESTANPPQATGCDQGDVTYRYPPAYFTEALEDAELLLKYAAEIGVEVDDKTRNSVLQARAAVENSWSEKTVANLLAALTVLAAKLKPVTAESLCYFSSAKSHPIRKLLSRVMKRSDSSHPKTEPVAASPQGQSANTPERKHKPRRTVVRYVVVAGVLALLIVPFSIASFVTSNIATMIRNDITTANDLAVKLTAQFGVFAKAGQSTAAPADPCQEQFTAPPAAAAGSAISGAGLSLPPGLTETDAVTELQTFASLIRSIYTRSLQLNHSVWNWAYDPFARQLNPDRKQTNGNDSQTDDKATPPTDPYRQLFQLPVPLPTNLQPVVSCKVVIFQDARKFGQDTVDDVSLVYGAMGTCILPILYALLGTCAFLLRTYAQGMNDRTFVPSHSDSAHFFMAGIAGCVVGLFNLNIAQGASLSPLAIAFLVGYSVNVFFSFLDTLIQAFTKGKGDSNKPASSQLTGSSKT